MKRINFRFFETILVLFSCLILGIILSKVPGRQAHTDVLWYMNMGFNNLLDAHWFTRYSHVFIQKIFLSITTNLFLGIKFYWAFLIATSTALIYLISRNLLPKSTFIHAGLSVGLFFAFHLHGDHAGVPWADITSMFLILVIVGVYLISAKKNHSHGNLIALLGFLFIVAFKAKETLWITPVLIFGLGITKQGEYNFKILLKNCLYIIYGALGGILFFILLNGALLGDALFDFRLSTWETYINVWLIESPYYPGAANWYTNGILVFFPYAFILYVMSALNLGGNKSINSHLKIIWALPLLLILFLTVGMVKNTFIVHPRFLYPAYAIIVIFAPQTISFEIPKERKQLIFLFSSLFISLILYWLIYKYLGYSILQTGINFNDFVPSIVLPIIFSALLLTLIFIKEFNYKNVFLPIILFLAIMRPGIFHNIRHIQLESPSGSFQTRFYPLTEFENLISISPDMIVFISQEIPETTGFFSANIDTIRTVFDIHFRVQTSRDNYIIEEPLDHFIFLLEHDNLDYAFFTIAEWEGLINNPDTFALINSLCTTRTDSQNIIVFVNCR